jgi:hypothetical protein
MVQPWARERSAKTKSIPVSLRYTFGATSAPSGDLMLAVEQPERYRITVNGCAIDTDTQCGWWVDRSLRTLRVDPSIVRVGTNEVVLSCDYDEDHPGFEIIYLLGSFGVKVHGTDVSLTARPRSLKLGSWVRQGLPFYSGSVGYTTTVTPKLRKGERLFVSVPQYKGVAARVLVDGQQAGMTAWEPNEVEITKFVTGSPVSLCVEVIGHRRNSHGPLHQKSKDPGWTGPGNYVTRPWDWTEEYHLVATGLMKEPVLVTRR